MDKKLSDMSKEMILELVKPFNDLDERKGLDPLYYVLQKVGWTVMESCGVFSGEVKEITSQKREEVAHNATHFIPQSPYYVVKESDGLIIFKEDRLNQKHLAGYFIAQLH